MSGPVRQFGVRPGGIPGIQFQNSLKKTRVEWLTWIEENFTSVLIVFFIFFLSLWFYLFEVPFIYASSIPNVVPYAYCACGSVPTVGRPDVATDSGNRWTSEILHRQVVAVQKTGRTDETVELWNSCMDKLFELTHVITDTQNRSYSNTILCRQVKRNVRHDNQLVRHLNCAAPSARPSEAPDSVDFDSLSDIIFKVSDGAI